MKLSFGSLLALALVSDAKKKSKNQENDNKVQFVEKLSRKSSGHLLSGSPWQNCVYAFNEDHTILTLTTIKSPNEKTYCSDGVRCSDGYVLHRNIASIQGLCHTEHEPNHFSFEYWMRLYRMWLRYRLYHIVRNKS